MLLYIEFVTSDVTSMVQNKAAQVAKREPIGPRFFPSCSMSEHLTPCVRHVR